MVRMCVVLYYFSEFPSCQVAVGDTVAHEILLLVRVTPCDVPPMFAATREDARSVADEQSVQCVQAAFFSQIGYAPGRRRQARPSLGYNWKRLN